MATDLAKMSIPRIISMTFYDKNTGEVLDEWSFDRCKNLEVQVEVGLTPSAKKEEDWDIYDLVMGK